MSDLNSVNAEQAVVVEQPEASRAEAAAANPKGQAQAHDLTAANGVATRSQKQSESANRAFAELRRRAEAAEQRLAEKENENGRLSSLIASQYGYQGDASAVADQLEAAATGRDVADIRADRERMQAKNQEIESLKSRLAQYEPLAVEQFKAGLLAQVKEVYPDESAQSVDEFGEEFARLIAADVSPATAYAAVKSVASAKVPPKPPEIGKVGKAGEPEPEFYTAEEVRERIKKDPNFVKKNFEKIRAGMSKW